MVFQVQLLFTHSGDHSKSQLGEVRGGFGEQPVLSLCKASFSVGLGHYDSLMQWIC